MKWLIFTMPLLLSACVVGRDYTSPEMPIPQKWSENVATQKTSQEWWKSFNDEALNSLMNEALGANLNIKQA